MDGSSSTALSAPMHLQAASPQRAGDQGTSSLRPAPSPAPRNRLPRTRAAALMDPPRPASSPEGPPGSPLNLRLSPIASTASSALRPMSAYEPPPSATQARAGSARPVLPAIRNMKRADPLAAALADVPAAAPSQPSKESVQAGPEQRQGQGQGQGQGQQAAGHLLDALPASAAVSSASAPLPQPLPLAPAPLSSLPSTPASSYSTPRKSDTAYPFPSRPPPSSPASSFQALAPTSLPSFSSSRSRASSLPRGGGSLAAFSTGSGHHTYPASLAPHFPASPAPGAEPNSLTLRLHVITFNMGNITPSRLPPEMFGVHRGDADVYVVGTQESCPLSDLDRLLAEQLPESQYARVASRSLMAISIHVFVRRDVEHLAACISAVAVPTGIGNVLGNKGGVAIGLRLAGAHILLVNCHLAAHDAFVERRNADFHRICAGLPQPPQRVLATAAAAAVGATASAPDLAPRPSAGSDSSSMAGSGTFLTTVSTPQAAQTSPDSPSYPARILTSHASPAPLTPRHSPSPLPRPFSTSGAPVPPAPTEPPLLRPGGPARLPHNYHPSAGPGAGRGRRTSGSEYAPPRMNRVASSADVGGGLNGAGAAGAGSALNHYDVVLWAGDLNYRIQGIVQGVKHALDKGMYEVLAANDQLGAEQRGGRAFQGFHEQPLNFVPTFKFVHNSDAYNLKRIPSWTDRVLFLCNSPAAYCALRPLYYNCIHEMKESDHRPVVAGFEVVLNPTKKHMRHHVDL